MKRILLLINPKSRTGEGAYERLRDVLHEAGHSVIELSQKEQHEDFKNLIRKYEKDTDVIVIGGGDGSVNFILPALVSSKIPLAVYPLGTANLLARSFNITSDTQSLLKLIEEGQSVTIDLGKVNGIYFINVCGLGISTEVNRKLPKWLKKLTGACSFWIMGLWLRRTLKPFKMHLQVDDMPSVSTRTWQITVCNGRRYGSWMTIDPNASYDDETLHCLSTEVSKWWQGMKLLPCYLKGSYTQDLEVTFLAGKKIRIETKRPLKIDVDGDVQTSTPALFEIEPKAMNLLIPRQLPLDAPIDNV